MLVRRMQTVLAASIWTLGAGLVCALLATNIGGFVGEVIFPLPYPLDEGFQQAARADLYSKIGAAGFALGGVSGFLIFLARSRARACQPMKAI